MTSDLITRLSKLDAPDREVDAQIYILFNIPAERAGRIDYSNGMVGWWPKDGPYVSAVTVPAYTASVDAAIALAERVLPGWTFEHIGQDYIRARGLENDVMPMGWTVEISDGSQTIQGQAPTFPLAICIALLRAKEASNAD